jgi:hypothetical protein
MLDGPLLSLLAKITETRMEELMVTIERQFEH